MKGKLAAAAFATLLALAGVELVLRLWPGLLPASYRARFPQDGIELFQPGVLSRTPIEGFAFPRVPKPLFAEPPQDLKELGIADPASRDDAERWGRVRVPSDARGLPNPEALDRADVVLVGDSFLVSAGATEPEGLVRGLARTTGESVYSLGISGIGPLQEAWLLEHVGLPLQPELVVWFFFGGNDLSDAKNVLELQGRGLRTRDQLDGYRAPGPLRLLDLLASGPASAPSGELPGSLPPLSFAGQPTWLHPLYLSRCALDEAAWRGHVAFERTLSTLRDARDLCRASGARLALVYLPSKAEVLLPSIESDASALVDTMLFDTELARPGDAEAVRARLLANRRSLARLLESFCREEDVPFHDATPALEALAAGGDPGFLVADTHWSPSGQQALLPGLAAFLRENGLLGD